MGRRWELIELGSGTSRKVRILLDAASGAGTYVPIDISREALLSAANRLARDYPHVRVVAVCADYTKPLSLTRQDPIAKRIVFFPGSTIGNFDPKEAVTFMRNAAAVLRPGDLFIVGADLQKDPAVLHAAYNDASGVTAKFNCNLLGRMNRELGATFNWRAFEHVAFYDVPQGRIEMHLRSLQRSDGAGRRDRDQLPGERNDSHRELLQIHSGGIRGAGRGGGADRAGGLDGFPAALQRLGPRTGVKRAALKQA